MDGKREALIIAASTYDDPELMQLRAPAADARALAGALGDPAIGNFTVTSLSDQPSYVLSEKLEDFFVDRSPEDLLLLHLSCHGVKDESGDLYFATTSTKRRRLAATAISAEYIKRLMGRSLARRIVLLLDCCYSGAFEQGMLQRGDTAINMDHFAAGRGRAVITASSSMEYAFEGGSAEALTVTQPSVFTGALVRGLTTGDADLNDDGLITVEELYHFVADEVRVETPHQTPRLSMIGMQDQLVIAYHQGLRRSAQLPDDVLSALSSDLPGVRMAVIPELARILHGRQISMSAAAGTALEALRNDDSGRVRAEAARVLAVGRPEAAMRDGPAERQKAQEQPPPPQQEQRASATTRSGPAFDNRPAGRRVTVPEALALSAYALIALTLVIVFAASSASHGFVGGHWLRPGAWGPVLALAVAVIVMTAGRFRLDAARAGLMAGAALGICKALASNTWDNDQMPAPVGFDAGRLVLGIVLLGCAGWALALASGRDNSARDTGRRGVLLVVLACAALLVDLAAANYPWKSANWGAAAALYALIAAPVAVLAVARVRDRPSYRMASAVVAGLMLVEMFGPVSRLLVYGHHARKPHPGATFDVAAATLLGLTALLAGWTAFRAHRSALPRPSAPVWTPADVARPT